MACFSGLRGGSAAPELTEVVRPAGLGVEPRGAAPRVRLLAAEYGFASGPLACASYPGLAFRLARCDVAALKGALSAALAAHPLLAGRLLLVEVALTNDGVPFTVRDSPERSAPEVLEEKALLHFGDFRRPQRVRRGLEPLMTVKLTRFRDGSAVLAMCRSHGLLDGTAAWVFIADWAAASRGEFLKARTAADRAALQALMPSEERLGELMLDFYGEKLTKKSWAGWTMEYTLKALGPVMDSLFLSGTAFPNRPRLFLASDEVERIKVAATPAPGSAGDGWVSTQEALAAYILLTVGRATLPADSKGRALLLLFLDCRTALGLPKTTCTGNCLAIVPLRVGGILQMDLAELAQALHEAAKKEASPEMLRKSWLLHAGLSEQGMPLEALVKVMEKRADSDITLQLNNQSKRVLPDFGGGASGGQAQAVLTNAGPTLLLPATGGLNVLLCPQFIGSGERGDEVMRALRSQIPKQASSPRLLGTKPLAELKGLDKNSDAVPGTDALPGMIVA